MGLNRLPLWVSFDFDEEEFERFIVIETRDRHYLAEEDGTVWELVDGELEPAEHIVQELACP